MKHLLCLVLLAGIARAASAGPSVLFVDHAAPPGGDGLSWVTAFDDLQAALDAAATGTQVWIADGTYVPSVPSVPGDPRSASFALPGGIALFGGFEGDETSLDERAVDAFPAVLSGDRFGNDGPGFTGNAENCHHVVTIDSATGITIDGLTIRGGHADLDDGASGSRGAGLLLQGGGVLLRACTISGHSAAAIGGGLDMDASSTLSAFETVFRDNIAGSRAGAARVTGGATFSWCTFEGNSCDTSGGAVVIISGAPRFNSCTFYLNTAVNGGAVRADGGDGEFRACQFIENRADRGGAIHVVGATDIDMRSCVFTGNTANVAGGAVYAAFGSDPFLGGCLLTGNVSASGGAVFAQQGSDLLLLGCTVTGNLAEQVGGVLNELTATSSIKSCILWSNTDDTGSGESAQVTDTGAASADVAYSCIQGLAGGIAGPGNIGADPLFIDAVAGDLRLQPTSPCIDAGSALWIGFCTLDLDGASRYFDDQATPNTGPDVDIGGVPVVDDMGAFEFGSPLRSDCDGNAYDDQCQIPGASLGDCNGNGLPDICELLDGTSVDVNSDGIPDQCQDCNGNGVLDPEDIDVGLESDCNGNDVPDQCEIADGSIPDVDGNGVPDGCQDCNGNMTFDPDEIAAGAPDCDGNGRPDDCDLADGADRDCDGNGQLDACDLATGVDDDCNGNGVPDACDLNDGFAIDDGVADSMLGTPSDPDSAFVFANQYDAGPGAVIDAISVAFPEVPLGNPMEIGDPVTLFVWDDPNGDGLPDDAVELVQIAGTVSTLNTILFFDDEEEFVNDVEPEVFDVFPIEPTYVSGSFFVGALTTTSNFPAAFDWLDVDPGRGFILSSTDGLPSIQDATSPSFFGPRFYVRALGMDCDANGLLDVCDTASGGVSDDDANGVPDACERPEDVNRDGAVDIDDLVEVVLEWGPCSDPPAFCFADVDGSTVVDIDDLVAVVIAFD